MVVDGWCRSIMVYEFNVSPETGLSFRSSCRKCKILRPILTTHIFFLLFFFLSLILPFSCLRFFSDLTANVTFFSFL